MDYKSIRKQTQDAVDARPFTRVPGQPTFEQREKILKELVMSFAVSYLWAREHGLLTKVMGAPKYQIKTSRNYVPSARPPIAEQRILGGILTQTQIRVSMITNGMANIDYHVVEGFRWGFGKNFQNTF